MKSIAKRAGSRRLLGTTTRASPYVSKAQTSALLTSSAPVRNQRLNAADMLSVAGAAMVSGTTVSAVRLWIERGRVIAIPLRNTYRLPEWQFASTLWDAIPQLTQALGTNHGWTLLSFLETPLGSLGGWTPRQAIERGDLARLLFVAADEA